ncbi:MAG: GYD domain-containing protein [Roseibium sp.]|uniref:GYD domain-containing protein n=1 Tax=Roseibium sp. TaxID=1936156 RepID=UPI002603F5C6|nr:GYD domain-containing protein [Roseibium sp.]MCV0425405.1 GYD domain-containing protein [Roseibium sp.]
MPRFIVSGSYTAVAMKAMVANPGDREGTVRAVVEAAGGRLESYLLTTGKTDFTVTVTVDDVTNLLAGLLATGASGAISNLKTVQAFTSDEFTAMQKKAGAIASVYKAPGS